MTDAQYKLLERVAGHKRLRDSHLRLLDEQRAEAIQALLDDGWTYRKLAQELGVSHTLIHQWAHPKGYLAVSPPGVSSHRGAYNKESEK